MFARPSHVALHARHRRGGAGCWIVLVLVVLAMMSMNTADAFWTGSSGNASGSGVTGTSLSLVMTPGTPSTSLRPGGQADVVLTVTNPDPEAVDLVSITLDTSRGAAGLSVDAPHAACDTAALTFTHQTGSWMVPARVGSVDGTVDIVLADSMSMAVDAVDACQGAQFSVHLRAGS